MPFLPQQAAISCLRRAKRFLELAEKDLEDAKIRNDLRRSALVMAVTAVDAYIHGIVLRRLSKVRWRAELPKALSELDVPFADLAVLAETALQSQRSKTPIRPWVQVKNVVHSILLKQTFQSFDQVGRGFALAGISKGWTKVAGKLGESTTSIQTRLNNMVHRRNQIVHEGDMARKSRPQKLSFNWIDHEAVKSDIEWIEGLVGAIQDVIESEP